MATWCAKLFLSMSIIGLAQGAGMMKLLTARSLAAAGVPDPHCKSGVISLKVEGKPQSCCPGYCGACNDYKTCKNVRGQASEKACCASALYENRCGNAPANVCWKTCSEAVPPCIMDIDASSMAPIKVTAVKGVPPCNEVVPVARQIHDVAIKKGNILVNLHKAEAEGNHAVSIAQAAKADLQLQASDPEISKDLRQKYAAEAKLIDKAIPEYSKGLEVIAEVEKEVNAINARDGISHKVKVNIDAKTQLAHKLLNDALKLKGDVFHLYGEGAEEVAKKAEEKANVKEEEAKKAAEAAVKAKKEKEEAEKKRAEAAAKAKKEKEEADRKAAEEAAKKAKEEADQKAAAAKKAAEEAKKKAEEERKAKEEAARKAAAIPASSGVGSDWSWCVLSDEGSILCWYGGYPCGSWKAPEGSFRALAGSSGSYCAIKAADSTLQCFGCDNYGLISHAPKGVKVSAFVKSNVAPSDMCVIRESDQKLQCWGYQYTYGEKKSLKPGTFESFFADYSPPVLDWCPKKPEKDCMKSQDPGVPVKAAAIGYTGGCAVLSEDKTAYCWGSNPWIFNRNFIDSSKGNPEVVAETPANEKFKDITVTDFSACAIKESDSKLSCWGMNQGTLDNIPTEPVKMVRATRYTFCALKQADSTVACWGGANDEKQLVSNAPQGVPFDDLMIGMKIICGVKKEDKKLMCWGLTAYMNKNMAPSQNMPDLEACCK